MAVIDRWIANIAIVAVLIIGGHWLDARQARAEDALCVLRTVLIDSQVSDRASQQRARTYLADVQAGRREPIRGITDQDIKDGIKERGRIIANRERSIEALSIINCKGV